ncbi:MAG: O-methyltransferase [Lachnospiraceae bacterium]|nr:O-methyltransferase [Lachnospiraceae bacterium]
MRQDESRTQVYIDSLKVDCDPYFEQLRQRADETNVPVIRRSAESFIRTILSIKQPENILEIGCATGYSALVMASCTKQSTQITTIEKYDKRIAEAKENFKASPNGHRITLLEGDASDILKELVSEGKKYDFIFMDAAKAQYIVFLPFVMELLLPEGILLSDNVLWEGGITESKYALIRRDRTIHKRMREYLKTISNMKELTTTVLDIGDGMALSKKNR